VAEWLCSGLQSRGPRFDSGLSLQFAIRIAISASLCPGGEIGRRKRLKISRPLGRAGSIPAPGTKPHWIANATADCRVGQLPGEDFLASNFYSLKESTDYHLWYFQRMKSENVISCFLYFQSLAATGNGGTSLCHWNR
jgi:hypothetical protein